MKRVIRAHAATEAVQHVSIAADDVAPRIRQDRLPTDPRTYTVALAGGGTEPLPVATVDAHTVRPGRPLAWLPARGRAGP